MYQLLESRDYTPSKIFAHWILNKWSWLISQWMSSFTTANSLSSFFFLVSSFKMLRSGLAFSASVKLIAAISILYWSALIHVPASLPTTISHEAASYGATTWIPDTPLEHHDWVLGCWLQTGLLFIFATIWGWANR